METIRIYTFSVRKAFGPFKVKDTFKAAVRTHVVNGIEVQDFNFEDGNSANVIPCEFTRFKEQQFPYREQLIGFTNRHY